METKKNKHMTEEDRKIIEDSLRLNNTFRQIAKNIHKDETTVSKEVKRNISIMRAAKKENSEICPKLLRAPYVCNGCERKSYCRLEIHVYNARNAQRAYETNMTESRTGIALNKEYFYQDDKIITEGLKNGQHLYHIFASNKLHYSIASIYRNINNGYLSAGRIDLPRAVKFRPRKKDRLQAYVPPAVKKHRMWDDFLEYIDSQEIASWVEADTVIGNPGGKVLATFIFTDCNFMFALLLDDKTAASMTTRITEFKMHLKNNGIDFHKLIPVILTDNGGEFSNVDAFINDPDGNKASEMFFCEPYKSCEKPHVEKNHTLLRDICPKGISFDNFTQDDVNIIFSHINNVKRNKLSKKSPYELFTFMYGTETALALGIHHIPENQVCQSPELLKKLKLNS